MPVKAKQILKIENLPSLRLNSVILSGYNLIMYWWSTSTASVDTVVIILEKVHICYHCKLKEKLRSGPDDWISRCFTDGISRCFTGILLIIADYPFACRKYSYHSKRNSHVNSRRESYVTETHCTPKLNSMTWVLLNSFNLNKILHCGISSTNAKS